LPEPTIPSLDPAFAKELGIAYEVADLKERRKVSRDFMHDNYWGEFLDAWRAINCRTKKIYVRDSKGEDTKVEDLSRTNVCMPDLAVANRKKVARLTASPPQINYRTEDPNDSSLVSDRMTALSYQEYDRSSEAYEQRMHVMQASALGISYDKSFWDTVEVTRQFRYNRSTLNRQKLMELQGAPQAEIDGALQEQGPDLTQSEISSAIADYGPQLKAKVPVTKYDGPVTRWRFIGDIHLEPGYRKIHDSAWVIEDYEEGMLWLQKQALRTYIDPESGEERPAFDKNRIQELVDGDKSAGESTTGKESVNEDLKQFLRASISKEEPVFPKRLIPGKRFRFNECHEFDKYGRCWITWMANEKLVIGRQPYPWDLYGRYLYGELIPMPSLLGAVGDSNPRLLRYLHALHNAAVGSRRDLVNIAMRPLIPVRAAEDIPDEVIDRSMGRFVIVKDPERFKWEQAPQIPAAAYEEEAQVVAEMNRADPNIGNVESGNEANPQAGKTATTAILAAKSSDVLTNDELQMVAMNLKDRNERKLWMRQQQEGIDQYKISGQYMRTEALTEKYGKTAVCSIEAMELQQEIDVEPEAMSILSVDDELKRNSAQTLYLMAKEDPINFNSNYAAQTFAKTIRGVDVAKAVNPPAPPAGPEVRVSANVAIKWAELTAEEKIQILQSANLQVSPEDAASLHAEEKLQGVTKMGEAANAAATLHEQAVQDATDSGDVKVPGLKKVQ
jgi:hypothetical protein